MGQQPQQAMNGTTGDPTTEVAALSADRSLLEKLESNARFYEAEALALKPLGARHLGPQEASTIAGLLRDAALEILQKEKGS